jgi:SH3-like domain-containing protein
MRWSAVALLLLSGAAAALDYRSVAETTVLYDAPSQKAKPLFVIAAGTPVEAIVTLDTWVKVRDRQGDLAWIERRLLTAEKRMLQVRTETAQIRIQANDSADVAFEAAPDVLLELLEPGNDTPVGWLKVRHRDGQQGFVKVGQVWGF